MTTSSKPKPVTSRSGGQQSQGAGSVSKVVSNSSSVKPSRKSPERTGDSPTTHSPGSSSSASGSSHQSSLTDKFAKAHAQSQDGSGHVGGLDRLWVPDSFSSDCMKCGVVFGFLYPRRHNCRVCGLLYCSRCVDNKATIPITFGYGIKPQHCCDRCADLLHRNLIKNPRDIFAKSLEFQS